MTSRNRHKNEIKSDYQLAVLQEIDRRSQYESSRTLHLRSTIKQGEHSNTLRSFNKECSTKVSAENLVEYEAGNNFYRREIMNLLDYYCCCFGKKVLTSEELFKKHFPLGPRPNLAKTRTVSNHNLSSVGTCGLDKTKSQSTPHLTPQIIINDNSIPQPSDTESQKSLAARDSAIFHVHRQKRNQTHSPAEDLSLKTSIQPGNGHDLVSNASGGQDTPDKYRSNESTILANEDRSNGIKNLNTHNQSNGEPCSSPARSGTQYRSHNIKDGFKRSKQSRSNKGPDNDGTIKLQFSDLSASSSQRTLPTNTDNKSRCRSLDSRTDHQQTETINSTSSKKIRKNETNDNGSSVASENNEGKRRRKRSLPTIPISPDRLYQIDISDDQHPQDTPRSIKKLPQPHSSHKYDDIALSEQSSSVTSLQNENVVEKNSESATTRYFEQYSEEYYDRPRRRSSVVNSVPFDNYKEKPKLNPRDNITAHNLSQQNQSIKNMDEYDNEYERQALDQNSKRNYKTSIAESSTDRTDGTKGVGINTNVIRPEDIQNYNTESQNYPNSFKHGEIMRYGDQFSGSKQNSYTKVPPQRRGASTMLDQERSPQARREDTGGNLSQQENAINRGKILQTHQGSIDNNDEITPDVNNYHADNDDIQERVYQNNHLRNRDELMRPYHATNEGDHCPDVHQRNYRKHKRRGIHENTNHISQRNHGNYDSKYSNRVSTQSHRRSRLENSGEREKVSRRNMGTQTTALDEPTSDKINNYNRKSLAKQTNAGNSLYKLVLSTQMASHNENNMQGTNKEMTYSKPPDAFLTRPKSVIHLDLNTTDHRMFEEFNNPYFNPSEKESHKTSQEQRKRRNRKNIDYQKSRSLPKTPERTTHTETYNHRASASSTFQSMHDQYAPIPKPRASYSNARRNIDEDGGQNENIENNSRRLGSSEYVSGNGKGNKNIRQHRYKHKQGYHSSNTYLEQESRDFSETNRVQKARGYHTNSSQPEYHSQNNHTENIHNSIYANGKDSQHHHTNMQFSENVNSRAHHTHTNYHSTDQSKSRRSELFHSTSMRNTENTQHTNEQYYSYSPEHSRYSISIDNPESPHDDNQMPSNPDYRHQKPSRQYRDSLNKNDPEDSYDVKQTDSHKTSNQQSTNSDLPIHSSKKRHSELLIDATIDSRHYSVKCEQSEQLSGTGYSETEYDPTQISDHLDPKKYERDTHDSNNSSSKKQMMSQKEQSKQTSDHTGNPKDTNIPDEKLPLDHEASTNDKQINDANKVTNIHFRRKNADGFEHNSATLSKSLDNTTFSHQPHSPDSLNSNTDLKTVFDDNDNNVRQPVKSNLTITIPKSPLSSNEKSATSPAKSLHEDILSVRLKTPEPKPNMISPNEPSDAWKEFQSKGLTRGYVKAMRDNVFNFPNQSDSSRAGAHSPPYNYKPQWSRSQDSLNTSEAGGFKWKTVETFSRAPKMLTMDNILSSEIHTDIPHTRLRSQSIHTTGQMFGMPTTINNHSRKNIISSQKGEPIPKLDPSDTQNNTRVHQYGGRERALSASHLVPETRNRELIADDNGIDSDDTDIEMNSEYVFRKHFKLENPRPRNRKGNRLKTEQDLMRIMVLE